jgi:hypothetical protein
MATGLLLLMVVVVTLAQEVQFIAICDSPLQLPVNLCSDSDHCNQFDLLTRLDNLGNTFVLNPDTGQLVVVSPKRDAYKEYQLPTTLTHTVDFAPFDNNYLVVVGSGFYKYDFRSQQVTPLPLDPTSPQKGLEFCEHNMVGPEDYIYRVDLSHTVLVCLREYKPQNNDTTHPDIRSLALYNVETHSLTTIASTRWYIEDTNSPWGRIIIGQDGNIYSDRWQRYNPHTGVWSDTKMPVTSEAYTDYFRLSAVDGASNMYFSYEFDANKFLKYSPSGAVEWIAVPKDLKTSLIDVTSDGKLIMVDYSTNSGQIKECTVSSQIQTLTPTPVATVR